MLALAVQGEDVAGLGPGLMRAGLSLQGHLNWPPFCLVLLNVTHLTHQVIIDRFNRKVRPSQSWCPGQASSQQRGRAWAGGLEARARLEAGVGRGPS